MNPAEFLLDLANGNINDISVPSELEDRVQVGNSGRETQTGKPSPAAVHEVITFLAKKYYHKPNLVLNIYFEKL